MNANARLDLRLSPKDKTRIARAARLRGVPVSVFVRDAVLHEADSVVASAPGAAHGRSSLVRARKTAAPGADRFDGVRGIAQVKWRTEELMALLRKPDRA